MLVILFCFVVNLYRFLFCFLFLFCVACVLSEGGGEERGNGGPAYWTNANLNTTSHYGNLPVRPYLLQEGVGVRGMEESSSSPSSHSFHPNNIVPNNNSPSHSHSHTLPLQGVSSSSVIMPMQQDISSSREIEPPPPHPHHSHIHQQGINNENSSNNSPGFFNKLFLFFFFVLIDFWGRR
jgi:hypothetical protein